MSYFPQKFCSWCERATQITACQGIDSKLILLLGSWFLRVPTDFLHLSFWVQRTVSVNGLTQRSYFMEDRLSGSRFRRIVLMKRDSRGVDWKVIFCLGPWCPINQFSPAFRKQKVPKGFGHAVKKKKQNKTAFRFLKYFGPVDTEHQSGIWVTSNRIQTETT